MIFYGFSKFHFIKLPRAGNGNTMDGPSLIRRELILSANKVSSGNIDHLENHRGDPDLWPLNNVTAAPWQWVFDIKGNNRAQDW